MRITIGPAQEQSPKGIFKPGSLVVSKSESASIVLVSGGNTKEFSGVVISSNNSLTGDYFQYFCKESFVKFIGSVLLEQG